MEQDQDALDLDATVDADAHTPGVGLWQQPTLEACAGDTILGVGGNCEVRLGTQTSLAREVAIKRLLPARCHQAGQARLLAEARLLGKLEHPNIVPIHGLFFDQQGFPCLVLKRITGKAWNERLARDRDEQGRLRHLEQHLRILMKVCLAISFAHKQGVLHLDIKPRNVMLGDHGEVYLVDWGSALTLAPGERGVNLPPGSSPRGTLRYLPPELARAAQGTWVDGRADIFSLGLVVRDLLLGPRQGSAQEVSPDPALARLAPELRQIVLRATAQDPEARFANAEALRQALEVYLRHENARELGRAADASLKRLRALVACADSSMGQKQEAFIECRFACDQSLRQFADQPQLRAVRDQAHHLMIQQALQREDVEEAQAFLEVLFTPHEGLEAQLQATRSALEARRRSAERAEAALQATNIFHGLPDRRRAVFWMSTTTMIGGVLMWSVVGSPPALSLWEMLSMDALYLGILVTLRGPFRRRYMPNQAAHRLQDGVIAMYALGLLCDTMGLAMGLALEVVVVWRLFVCATSFAFMAHLLATWRLWITTALYGAGILTVMGLPTGASVVWALSYGLPFLITSLISPRRAQQKGHEPSL